MVRVSVLILMLVALSGPVAARQEQARREPWLTATCESGGAYGSGGAPVAGWILRFGQTYSIDLYVPAVRTRAAVGSLRENDTSVGWIRFSLTSPSLDLDDPELQVETVSMQGRAIFAEDHWSDTWRVRLHIGEESDWYGPASRDRSVFTNSSPTIDPPYATEPYIGFFNHDGVGPAEDIYRRVVEAGGLVAEFHVPRRGLRSGYLFAVSEYSIVPLYAFLDDARDHFAQCDAASGD